ncbi:hypothetical protein HDU86_005879 [Geranomyces michiganensis]|nr:hypothetical protein HDU86_005879 [Geranomyces michiganensis]
MHSLHSRRRNAAQRLSLPLLLLAIAHCPRQTHAAAYPTDSATGAPLPNAISTSYISARNLWRNRELQASGLRQLHPAVARVVRLADAAAADTTVYNVVGSAVAPLPPSNNTHDFFTLAPHWVRNPTTASGLPYVVDKNGSNPTAAAGRLLSDDDSHALQTVVDDAWYAGLAYFFTGDDRYAEVVARRVRQCFLDEATFMNPNLEYANYVPGRSAIVPTDTSPAGATSVNASAAALRVFKAPSVLNGDDNSPLPSNNPDLIERADGAKIYKRQLVSVSAGSAVPASPAPIAPPPASVAVPAVTSAVVAPPASAVTSVAVPQAAPVAVPAVPTPPSPALPALATSKPAVMRPPPPVFQGTLAGILDMPRLLDAISLTRSSPQLSPSNTAAFQSWCAHYLTWLQTSIRGQHESSLTDYRGVHTDMHEIAISLFLNDAATATSILTNRTLPRLATQIAPSGQIPVELAKGASSSSSSSWDASVAYISAMFAIGHMARNAPLWPDLFSVATSDGRSLRGAVEFLLPYALTNGSGWPVAPNNSDAPFEAGAAFVQLLKEAYVVWGDARYLAAVGVLQPQPEVWNPSKLWTPYDAFDVRVEVVAMGVRVRAAMRGIYGLVVMMVCLWLLV